MCHLLQFNGLQIEGRLMVLLTYRASIISIYNLYSFVCPPHSARLPLQMSFSPSLNDLQINVLLIASLTYKTAGCALLTGSL